MRPLFSLEILLFFQLEEVYVQKSLDFWPANGFDVSTACVAGSQGSQEWGPTGNLRSAASWSPVGRDSLAAGAAELRDEHPFLLVERLMWEGKLIVEQNEIRAQNIETFPPLPEGSKLHGWCFVALLDSL